MRSVKIDLEKNKYDTDGCILPSASTYGDDFKLSSMEQLKQINLNHERGLTNTKAPETLNVIYLDFSNQMTNIMIIPEHFKQAMILTDRIVDDEVIERLLLQNTID